MLKTLISLSLVAALASGGYSAFGLIGSGADRTDCPGKIVCPITDELVCKDRCPAGTEVRTDCPGKIECPITGELVCKDRCPLGKAEADQPVTRPCCVK